MTPHRRGSIITNWPRASLAVPSIVWRWVALSLLGAAAIPCYLSILAARGSGADHGDPFLLPGLGVTIIAIAGAWLVLRATSADTRWRCWGELTLILVVGSMFRAIFIGAPPALSHDAYRYVWDAHLVAHGVSPYAHTVVDPALKPLRDSVIWPQIDWRNAPTIYPPAAQALYLLVNSIAPLNIIAMKGAMEVCDALSALLTLVLLRRHRLDLRRVLIYWWNPIPIIEFAYSGHVDAAATLWTLLALLLALQHWRGARTLAGVALGLAVLTKLYPLLFIIALVRRRDALAILQQRNLRTLIRHLDWGLLGGLLGTCVVLYLPFLRLGLGSGGFLTTYFSQRFVDEGILFRAITTVFVNMPLQLALQAFSILGFSGMILWLRLRHALRTEATILALSVVWIAASPHLFPWYVAGLLPLLALYLRLPQRWRKAGMFTNSTSDLAGANALPAAALWLFTLAMPFTYVVFAPGHNSNIFLLFSAAPLALFILALLTQRRQSRHTAMPSYTALTQLPSSSQSLTFKEQ